MVVQQDSRIEIVQRLSKLTHVSEAAAAVVEVNGILWINLNGASEVLDSIFKILESVPNKTSAVIRGRVTRVYLYDRVEVLNG